MKWIKEKPTKEGWWFWKRSKKSYKRRWLVYYISRNLYSSYWPRGGYWAGPIEEPDDSN